MAKKDKESEVGGLAMGACVLLGVGIGAAFNQVGIGSIIGVGVGLLIMAALRAKA